MSAKIVAKVCIVLMSLGVMWGGMPAGAADKLHVITPEWAGQTNTDGSGLFFEIVRQVFEPAGVTVSWEFAPWKRCQKTVTGGKADAMLCVWQEHAAEEAQRIPKYPMYVEHTALIYKQASIPAWQGIATLDNRRAVWLRGYDYHTQKKFQSVQLAHWHEVDSHEDAWHQLNLDRFDVYIDALIDIDRYIREKKVDMSLYHKQVLWAEKAYVAFTNSDRSTSLIKTWDDRIQQLFKSGVLENIYRKWGQPFYSQYWEE